MPTLLRRMLANGFASVAAACLLGVTASGTASAGSRPTITLGAIGGVVTPRAAAGVRAALPAAETYGGPSASGSSPGGGTPPLVYGGGPVMHGVTTQVVAWAPTADPFPSGYVSGYEQYLADMATGLGLSSNISSITAQYIDANGPALSSLANNAPITDTDAYPTSGGCSVSGTSVCLTESQIINELAGVISSHALPVDESHSYIVLLPPSVDTCVDSGSTDCEAKSFCGYHTAFSVGSATTTFTLLPYTQSSYSNATGHCYSSSGPASISTAVNAVDSVGAHELFESATDPLVGSGYVDSTGEEIGDECAWTWGSSSPATGGGYYNQLVNADQYLIQEMWSDQGNACALGATSTAQATISPTSAALNSATGFSVALTGDASAASSYQWSYEAPNGAVSSNVSTAASPSLTLTSAGTYTVWVEVADAAGGTVTAVKNVTVASLPAPTANFSYASSTSVPAEGSPVSFTSTSAGSSSQSITASAWTFGDGASASGVTASHTYSAPGTYTVTLSVTQTNGQSTSISKTVTVTAPPTASIGLASSSPAANIALTFASGASAGAGSITAYSWSFGDSASSTSAAPTHTYTSAGTYTATLTVTQTDGLSTTVTRSITVAATPAPPTVSFTDSTTAAAPTPGTAVSFTSSATASAGSITARAWNFGDGSTSTSANPSHTYTSAGSYTVTLTVTATGGVTASTSHTVTVTSKPGAAISFSPSSPLAGSGVTFASGASAAAGSITAYSWNFGDGSTSTASAPTHTYSAAGTHTVSLTVTQTDGLATTVTKSITIAAPPPKPPTVSFTTATSAPAPTPGTAVNFTSSATAGNGSITAYSWNFGNGSSSSSANPSHTFPNPGSYTVTLTVTQTGGLTASSTLTVVVVARPAASFSWTTAQTPYAGAPVTFSTSATPGAGSITAYSWNFGDGGSSTAAKPAHRYAHSGTYTVTLTVTQSDGLTTTAQKTIVIAQRPAGMPTSGATSNPGGSTTVPWTPASTWLLQTIRTADAASTKIGRLLRANGSKAILTASPVWGQLIITWKATVHHRRVVIARSKGFVLAGVTPNVAIRLTRSGRRLLARQRRIKIAAQAIFRSAGSASRTTRRLTLRR